MNVLQRFSPLQHALLVLVPLLMFATTACDSNNSNMNETPEDTTSAPTAAFSMSKSGASVSFDASGSEDADGGDIQSYSWTFGDGSSGSGQTTSHTYGSNGSYDVTLEVVDDEGAKDDTTVTVDISSRVVVTDDITSNTTWTADKTYILDGLVFVENATLTIEPGTVIKGRRKSQISNNDGAGALIVKRNAKIEASGTADKPIVFTSTADDLSDPGDLGPTVRGLWGGLIVLGQAPTAEGTPTQIEGVPETAEFGGTQPGHSSGTLEYISIRHGGFSITGVSGDEINGLTLGGVGRGTTINHIEVFSNADDGIEWFGGTVHASHLVAAFCADDAFDWDTGFRGTGQYWFAVQGTDAAGRAGELDGFDSTTDENTEEFSDPVVSNVTFIGSGQNSGVGGNSPTLRIRNGGAGEWYNSIFTGFPNTAVRIDEDDTANQRWADGDITIRNNVFFGYGAGSDIPSIVEGTSRDSKLQEDNAYTDPQLAGVSRVRDGSLDPRPNASLPSPESKSNFANTSATPRDNYVGVDLSKIEDADYVGAFAPSGDLWTTGWTKLSTNGYMVQ